MTQHFFLFTKDEYSDYHIKGLFVADHIVTLAEWDAFSADKSKLVEKAKQASMRAYCERTNSVRHICNDVITYANGWTTGEEYSLWKEYQASQDAQELFIRCHGMKPVEVTELWRD